MRGLACIVLQEVFDSAGRGQPEIVEKGRACEAYGAEVWQLTVGPELFYAMLLLLEETGYFSASLYTPHAVAGIETLGLEIGERGAAPLRARSRRRRRHPRGRRQRDGHRPRPARRGLRREPGRRRQRRPARPAHGLRLRLQPQVVHHGPHRLRRSVPRQSRPRRRAAQRGAAAALPRPLRHGHAGRGLLHDRGAGPARGARAGPGRKHVARGRVRARAGARRATPSSSSRRRSTRVRASTRPRSSRSPASSASRCGAALRTRTCRAG